MNERMATDSQKEVLQDMTKKLKVGTNKPIEQMTMEEASVEITTLQDLRKNMRNGNDYQPVREKLPINNIRLGLCIKLVYNEYVSKKLDFSSRPLLFRKRIKKLYAMLEDIEGSFT